jgi:hypothetical protein
MRIALALLVSVLVAPAASAQRRDMQTIWFVQPAPVPNGELTLAGGDFVLKQRLLPMGLAELSSTIDDPIAKVSVAAGEQLVEVISPEVKIYCQARTAKQKLVGFSQVCLIDSDKDGRFDATFKTQSQTKGLLNIGGNRPKKPTPITPVAYTVVPPQTMKDHYFVAIERRNFFNIWSSESFTIAFGRQGELERITAPTSFKAKDMPKELNVLGARFTALSETAGKMKIRVHSAIPPQPFGVTKTVSYSFY